MTKEEKLKYIAVIAKLDGQVNDQPGVGTCHDGCNPKRLKNPRLFRDLEGWYYIFCARCVRHAEEWNCEEVVL
jgi:hypothetical protein